MFPARAGMSRPAVASGRASARVPRVSGDEPALSGGMGYGRVCSPRERG